MTDILCLLTEEKYMNTDRGPNIRQVLGKLKKNGVTSCYCLQEKVVRFGMQNIGEKKTRMWCCIESNKLKYGKNNVTAKMFRTSGKIIKNNKNEA